MNDRERWDEKYRGDLGDEVFAPEPLFLRGLEHVPSPRAGAESLDLSCGMGRHAIEAARRGWRASAWDLSSVGLEVLARRAAEAGVEVETRCVDLSPGPERDAALRECTGRFALVSLVHFLDRDLHGVVAGLLAPGGHLVFSTFTQDFAGERPSARFRLEPNELAGGLPGLETLLYTEEEGRALLVARRASASERDSMPDGSGRDEA